MLLSNRTYDILKFIVTIALPAFITFVSVVGVQLGYEMTTTIVILTAINTFIGALIGVSTVNYRKENSKNED